MSRLPLPLKHVLREPDERLVDRGWQRLRAARAEVPRRSGWAFGRLVLGASLLAGAAALGAVFAVPRSPRPGDGPLALADGTPLPAVLVADDARVVALADGSRLELAAQSELRVSRNERANLATQLTHGQIVFDVRPRTGRAWAIQVGPVRIDVLRTRFSRYG
jgi:ferric-dicitrate binding protein FerR (iron transport regulator)